MLRRSQKQKAASRANGRRSQGPITPEGKQLAAQNSRKHGLYAKEILLPGESEAAFLRLASHIQSRFDPDDYLEAILVQRMISAQWRLLRVWSFERLGLSQENQECADPALRDLAAFQNLHGQGRSGSILQLSELRYQRQFDRAMLQLEHLRKAHAYKIGETNLGTDSKETGNLENTEPDNLPNPPTKDPEPSQTDPPASQDEPKPQPLQ